MGLLILRLLPFITVGGIQRTALLMTAANRNTRHGGPQPLCGY